ncbi:DUF2950 domain-containing protein [Bosea sp. NBC_00550]|uniref:DUF2950 domain-containing protein n=1 Tax=Bosea sp. NBC_00550 TaxID=2969621 RepID=UPI0022324922|nr:DUF2950 domain-containing protein [Bosea sp. NBC_00550]UZF95715.1 DUF2950 domain-containing protein [Bosea sp. NBC_00550]
MAHHAWISVRVSLAVLMMAGPAAAQQSFPSPDAASSALIEAARAREPAPGVLDRIFGLGARDVLSTGDATLDRERLERFNEAAAEAVTLTPRGDATRILTIGKRKFEFPIPIVRRGEAWMFDIAAGRDEILNRTIGANELRAIEACQAYIGAQREYFRMDHDGDQVHEYAQNLISTPGTQDGLYWPRTGQADVSPLEGALSEALLNQENRAYGGYLFRILKAQGPWAPGGAHSYVINGKMISGFGLAAWPAAWGKTGVMTFICGHNGVVLQKNLGSKTSALADRLLRYDPDSSWAPVE